MLPWTFKMTLDIMMKIVFVFSVLSLTLERCLEAIWIRRYMHCWIRRLLRVAAATSRAVFQNTPAGAQAQLGFSCSYHCLLLRDARKVVFIPLLYSYCFRASNLPRQSKIQCVKVSFWRVGAGCTVSEHCFETMRMYTRHYFQIRLRTLGWYLKSQPVTVQWSKFIHYALIAPICSLHPL